MSAGPAAAIDGDTLALDDGRVLRLAGIEAPKPPPNADGERRWPLAEAAAAAGYHSPQTSHTTVAKSEAVQAALREARDELSSAAQITRADVLDGFMEAINLARLSADPQAMIKGWTEVGKMMGYYAPEVKKLEITGNQKRLQSKFEAMSDEDLMRVIDGEATVIDD